MIYTKRVPNPSSFGVVKLNQTGEVLEFIEKSQTFVSDLAIIGIYYFREGEMLKKYLTWLIEADLRVNNEYQFTDALEKMVQAGVKIHTAQVDIWLDCGNKNNILNAHHHYIPTRQRTSGKNIKLKNSTLIEPIYIGDNVEIENSVIGPFTSIAEGSQIQNCIIKESIIQEKTILQGLNISDSIIGHRVQYSEEAKVLNIGAFSSVGN